jgi:hypothetical protein
LLFSHHFQCGATQSVRDMISKLAELGWLFNNVKTYMSEHSDQRRLGLVVQVRHF